MGNDSNKITRTKDVATSNAEIELYLNTDALVRIINQYTRLKVRLGQWAEKLGIQLATIQDNTSGETTKAFKKLYGDFDNAHYQKLLDNTNKAIEIMRDDAKEAANKLRVHCENFYEIVVGNGINAADSTLATLTPILFLDTVYYDAGVMDDNTVDAATKLKNLDEDANDLYGILLSCHYREHLEDCSADIENIRSDCKNRTRLQVLERAFDNYVRDVKKFNEDISEKFGSIIDPDAKLNHTRSYDYSYVKDKNEIALLTRVVRDELHEMGYTDWEIDRAKKVSNLSEVELAALSEAMIAEGHENWRKVDEITVYRAFLSGNYITITETLDDYGVPPMGSVLSLVLAKHVSGSMVVTISDDGKSIEASKENGLRDPLNGIINSKNGAKVLEVIKPGLIEMAGTYAEASTHFKEGSKERALFYSNYVKNMVLADKFENLSTLLGDNKNKRYLVQSVDYDVNGVLTFEMLERKHGETFGLLLSENIDEDSIKYGWYVPDERVDGDTHVTMTTKYVVGYSKIGQTELETIYDDTIQKAIKEREELKKTMGREGLAAVGAGASVFYGLDPGIGRSCGIVIYDAADIVTTSIENGELCVDAIVDNKDDYIGIFKDLLPEKSAAAKLMDIKGDIDDNFMPGVSNTYKYFTEDSVEAAIKDRDNFARSQYTGSYGYSEIERKGEISVYGVAHSEIVAPEYAHSFEVHYSPGGKQDLQYTGLAKEGEWSDKFIDRVNNEIDNLPNVSEEEKIRCKKLVNGGYSINNIKKDSTKVGAINVDKTFEHVQHAFSEAYKDANADIRPDIGKDSAPGSTVYSIWNKQAEEGSYIDIEPEQQAVEEEHIDEE